MQDKFITTVERLTGRHVLTFSSNHYVGDDIEIELFMLGPRQHRAGPGLTSATASKNRNRSV